MVVPTATAILNLTLTGPLPRALPKSAILSQSALRAVNASGGIGGLSTVLLQIDANVSQGYDGTHL